MLKKHIMANVIRCAKAMVVYRWPNLFEPDTNKSHALRQPGLHHDVGMGNAMVIYLSGSGKVYTDSDKWKASQLIF